MGKIIEYKNLMCSIDNISSIDGTDMAIIKLTNLVNKNIMIGWEPFGNIIINKYFVLQTMIRRENDRSIGIQRRRDNI